jgi:hypothetical protein
MNNWSNTKSKLTVLKPDKLKKLKNKNWEGSHL